MFRRFICFVKSKSLLLLILTLMIGLPRLAFSISSLPVGIPIDIVFSIDSSGSMGPPSDTVDPKYYDRYNKDPENLRIQAAKLFMDSLNPSLHWVGVVSWDARRQGFPGIDFSFGPTNVYDKVRNLLDRIDSRGGTDLALGLGEGLKLLENSQRKRSKKVLLFLTDGIGNFDERALEKAKELKTTVYTVGLSVPLEAKQILENIAAETGGIYFPAPTAEALQRIFETIFQQVTEVFLDIETASLDLLAEAGQSTRVVIRLRDVSDSAVVALEPIEFSLRTTKGQLAKQQVTISKGEGTASTVLLAADRPGLTTVTASINGLAAKTTLAFVKPIQDRPVPPKHVDLDLIIDQRGVAVSRPMAIKTFLRDGSGNTTQADRDYPLTFHIDPITLKAAQKPQITGKSVFPGDLPFPRKAFAKNGTAPKEVKNGGTVEWKKALGPLTLKGVLGKGAAVFAFSVRFLEAAILKVSLETPDASPKEELVAAAIPGTPENLGVYASPDELKADGKDQSELTIFLQAQQDNQDKEPLPVCPSNQNYEIALESTLGSTVKPRTATLVTTNCNTRTEEEIILTSSTKPGTAVLRAASTAGLRGEKEVIFLLIPPTFWQLLFAALGGLAGGILQRYKKLIATSDVQPQLSNLMGFFLVIGLITGLTFYLAIYYGAYVLSIPIYRHALFAALLGTLASYVGFPILDKVVKKLGLQKGGDS